MRLSNSLGTGYSNIVTFYTGLSTIPNYNFELWDSTKSDVTDHWSNAGTISQVTSYDGSFAAKLNSKNTEVGAIHYGEPGSSGFVGGTPFTARPDSIAFWCTYDISINDFALVVLQLKANGITMSDTTYKISGKSNGWERHSFVVNYNSSASPDSMVLAFTNTDVFSGTIDPNSTITIDNVSFIGTNQNVPNSNLESWSVETFYKAESWASGDDLNSEKPYLVQKSPDAHSGSSAVKLENRVGGDNEQYASLKTGDDPYNWIPSFPISYKHQNLYGYYQFNANDGDSLFVEMSMYENGVQMGHGEFITDSSTAGYELFHVPIGYWTNATPDSCMISLRIYKNNGAIPESSTALFDDLSFESIISSVPDSPNEAGVRNHAILYPNPSNGEVHIQFICGVTISLRHKLLG